MRFKFLPILLSFTMIASAGCYTGPSVLQRESKDISAYIIKSGTSKGGGPVMTGMIIRDKTTGKIVSGAYASGNSTFDKITSGIFGLGQSLGSTTIGGYFFKEGMSNIRPDQQNINQTGGGGTGGSSLNLNYQSQGQKQEQIQLQ